MIGATETGTGAGRAARHGRVAALLDAHGLDALLLRRPANFAWYTGGANNRVDLVGPVGAACVLVRRDDDRIVTNNIEADRMRTEQTPDMEVIGLPWHKSADAAMRELTGERVGSDGPLDGAVDLEAEVAPLRYKLDPDALERLRAVGADTAAALDEAAETVAPGVTEHEAAAAIAAACRRRELFPSVLLAAADERIASYRHPLPAGATIERRAMLVASAERGGLYANLTRIVELEEPSPDLARRTAACAEILARTREEATRPGRALGEVFGDIQRFYAEAGFADEWRLHHQGGLTGYGSRELIATPDAELEIEPGQAFAWNPSITGSKAEETFVLSEHGPEVVTKPA